MLQTSYSVRIRLLLRLNCLISKGVQVLLNVESVVPIALPVKPDRSSLSAKMNGVADRPAL